MADNDFLLDKMEHHHIRPTANRLLILRTMLRGNEMVSLGDMEALLPTIDKSTIFRTLSLFALHGLIHAVDDGSGSMKYNVCDDDCNDQDSLSDNHSHFFCERCHRTFCLPDTPVPIVQLPPGFRLHTVNYVLKGLCPNCAEHL